MSMCSAATPFLQSKRSLVTLNLLRNSPGPLFAFSRATGSWLQIVKSLWKGVQSIAKRPHSCESSISHTGRGLIIWLHSLLWVFYRPSWKVTFSVALGPYSYEFSMLQPHMVCRPMSHTDIRFSAKHIFQGDFQQPPGSSSIEQDILAKLRWGNHCRGGGCVFVGRHLAVWEDKLVSWWMNQQGSLQTFDFLNHWFLEREFLTFPLKPEGSELDVVLIL